MRISHISLNAVNARSLSAFYNRVFGLVDRRPPRRLFGDKVSRGNGLPNSDIYVVWLGDPGDHGPFLEIMEHNDPPAVRDRAVDEAGYGHLCIEVRDIEQTLAAVLRLGGSLQGEVTDFGPEGAPHLLVYVRDPEGNVLELSQLTAGPRRL